MTLTELRVELEQCAENGCTADDVARLNQAWQAVRNETPQSYHAVIDDRLKALSLDVVLPEVFIATQDSDFTLHELNGYWHWYSCGSHFGDNYCSEDGFDTQEEAISDAVDFLNSVYNTRPEDNDFSDLEEPATSIDIDLADISPYQSGVHFALYEYDSDPGVRWQGLCQEPNESAQWWNTDADFSHLVSDRGYFNARTAAADCIFSLHTERGHSIEEAITLVYELALPIHTVIEENREQVTAYIEQLKAAEYAERWSRLWPTDREAIESAIQVMPSDQRDQAQYDMTFRTKLMPEQYWPSEA